MDWVPKALQRHMELSFEGSKRALYVRGDEVLLRELLANLLDNAICYGHDQGNIMVKVESYPSPRLSVEDDGPGIPELEMDKVFERFYRIPGSPGDGCGLGLAIVKEIADLHKARLELSRASAAGGTRIELVFRRIVENFTSLGTPLFTPQFISKISAGLRLEPKLTLANDSAFCC